MTSYRIVAGEERDQVIRGVWSRITTGYRVTDGIWYSATYETRKAARLVLRDACWGARGADDWGTHQELRIEY